MAIPRPSLPSLPRINLPPRIARWVVGVGTVLVGSAPLIQYTYETWDSGGPLIMKITNTMTLWGGVMAGLGAGKMRYDYVKKQDPKALERENE